MLYKTVAHNYSEGQSSFWGMKFTNTSMSEFCEQPPLYFYLLGNFYSLFGDHYLTDRVFTLLLFILFAFILHGIIRQLFVRPRGFFLLAIFFFLAVPVFCWSYVNQVIEPLLCVFTSLAILFFLQFVNSGKVIFTFLFTLALGCLFLTKGFQSCFVICLPVTYFLLTKFKKATFLFCFFSGLIFLVVLFLALRYYLPAAQWFECYYRSRLVLTMENVGNTTDNHFEIIGRFFTELIICLIFLVLLLIFLKVKKRYPLKFVIRNFFSNRMALAFLFSSFVGSFPYALSLVQRGFYLIPSFICFGLAVVYGLQRYWLFLFLFLTRVGGIFWWRVFAPVLFFGTLVYMGIHFTDYKRNEALLEDIEKILPYLKKSDTVAIDPARWNDFSLHAYLYMAKQVSLDINEKGRKFLIASKSTPVVVSLFKVKLETREIDLYAFPPR